MSHTQHEALPDSDSRARIVRAAARLLHEGGSAAVTTRAVAHAAGVPTPTIFRMFGDKDGLMEAVAEQVMADHATSKAARAAVEDGDPVADLRRAWRTHIEFGLANPDLFAMLATPGRTRHSPAAAAGAEILRARVARVAAAGRLAVAPERAVAMIHAAGTGVVLALLGQPPAERDPGLAEASLDAVLGAVLATDPAPPASELGALAVTLGAAVPGLPGLTTSERGLLTEWLGRVSAELARGRPG